MDGFNKMKQNLKKFFAIPTWFITISMYPVLPSDHPFKKGFSLREWERGQTKLCKIFDFFFWMMLLNFFFVVLFFLD